MENVSVVLALRMNRLKAGKAPIEIRAYVKGMTGKTRQTGVKVKPEHWDEKNRKVLKGEPNYIGINAMLSKKVSEIEGLLVNKSLSGAVLTKSRVKLIVEGKDPGHDFYAFVKKWIHEKYKNEETIRSYLSEITKLQRFRKDVSFGDLDVRFLTNYSQWMEKEGNKHNTVWKSNKWLKTMIRDAVKIGGYITDNPYEHFKSMRYKNPDKKWLNIDDCDKLEAFIKSDTTVMLRLVTIRFLLMCYSGLRFADAMKFDPKKHTIGTGDIVMRTQKADVPLELQTYPRLTNIVQLLRDNPVLKLTNRDFNRYLKVIAGSVGIELNLTCHVGRHTFGGLLAKMGVPEESAKILMAHKDINSTRIYYHVANEDLKRQMDKFKKL